MTLYKYFVMFLASSILFALSSLTSEVHAQEGNVTAMAEPKFLTIQHAQSGSISKINDTAYSLELDNVSKKSILFSDRPDRIVTSVSTADFIGNWTAGADSFVEDAPNAVLVVDDLEGQDTAVLELFNPIYDIDKRILKYEVTPDNATSINLPKEFGRLTLVVDPNAVNSQITD